MREILFRGKRTDNGEWVYGDLVQPKISDDSFYIFQKVCSGDRVDSSTIGEYTGLNDKNGNKIFEGDIVRFDQPKGEWGDVAEMIFESGEFRYRPITNAKKVWNCRLCDEEKTLTVIGNIHDNPGLIPSCQS